mgnify:FL=1
MFSQWNRIIERQTHCWWTVGLEPRPSFTPECIQVSHYRFGIYSTSSLIVHQDPDAKFTTQVSDVASELSHPQKPTGLNLFRQGVVGKADRPPCLECPVTNSNSGHVRDQALPAADASL